MGSAKARKLNTRAERVERKGQAGSADGVKISEGVVQVRPKTVLKHRFLRTARVEVMQPAS